MDAEDYAILRSYHRNTQNEIRSERQRDAYFKAVVLFSVLVLLYVLLIALINNQ